MPSFTPCADRPRHSHGEVADRSARSDSPVIDALLRMLALVGSRARATELLDLLTLAPVQKRFDIEPKRRFLPRQRHQASLRAVRRTHYALSWEGAMT